MAPANTGSLRSNRIAVTSRDHTNSDIRSQVTPGDRMLKIVVMKLMAPRIDLIPAKCSLKIAKSIEGLLCPTNDLSGG